MIPESIAIVTLSAAVLILFIMLVMQSRRNAEARTEAKIEELHRLLGEFHRETERRIAEVEHDLALRIAEACRQPNAAQ